MAKKKKKNTGREYEAEIKNAFKAINKTEEIEHSEIMLNQFLPGRTLARSGEPIEHEIDVNWVAEKDKQRTVIQGKDYPKNKVKKAEMMAFNATVEDIQDSRGIFISKGGFQSGALEWAMAKGIAASEFRTPTEEELRNRVLHIRVDIHGIPMTFLGMKDVVVNQAWLAGLSQIQQQQLQREFVIMPRFTVVKTKRNPEPVQLHTFAFNAKKTLAQFDGLYESMLSFTAPIEISGGGLPFPVLLDAFTFSYRVESMPPKRLSIDAEAPQLLRNVTGGDSYMIADINGERQAKKITGLPPTKFTPAANPKKSRRKNEKDSPNNKQPR